MRTSFPGGAAVHAFFLGKPSYRRFSLGRGAAASRVRRPVDIGRPVRDTAIRNQPGISMSHHELAKTIDDAFERRTEIGPTTKGPVRDAVEQALDLLDRGAVRVADEQTDGSWHVNQWLKKAVLLSFRLTDTTSCRSASRPSASAWGGTRCPLKYDLAPRAVRQGAVPRRARAPSCAARPTSRRTSC